MENRSQNENPNYSFLEKSEKYQTGLEKARESGDRQEAKLFRMEVMLDNAKLTRFLFELIEKKPETTIEELRLAAEQSDLVAHPVILESFFTNLENNRQRVLQMVDQYGEMNQAVGEDLGQTLFRYAIKKNGYYAGGPGGRIIYDNSYSLSLTLFFSDSNDFAKVDSRKNIAGFYSHDAKPRKSNIT